MDLAIGHLAHTGPTDLLVMDRNDPSYRMLAELTPRERHFVIRCSAASFGAARRMLRGEGPDSQRVTLTPCAAQAPLIRQLRLPPTLTVRWVRVRLSTSEGEVRVTSLRDERVFPAQSGLAANPATEPMSQSTCHCWSSRCGLRSSRDTAAPCPYRGQTWQGLSFGWINPLFS